MKKFILIIGMLTSMQLQAKPVGWHLEVVMGYLIDRSGISFQVFDGGCTQSEDFYLKVDKSSKEARLSLYRKNFDFCKAFFPYGRMINFQYNEIGINKNEAFKILNPINPGFIRY